MNTTRMILVGGGLALVAFALYSRYKGNAVGDALATSGGSGGSTFAPTEGRANAPTLGGDKLTPVVPVAPGSASPAPVESTQRTILPVTMPDERMGTREAYHPLNYR